MARIGTLATLVSAMALVSGAEVVSPKADLCPFNSMTKPELVQGGFQFLEGSLWDKTEKQLVISDVSADTLYSVKGSLVEPLISGKGLYTNGISIDNTGAYIGAAKDSLVKIDKYQRQDGTPTVLVNNIDGKTFNNPNDLVSDFDGNLFFTDPTWGGEGTVGKRGVYQLSAKGALTAIAEYDAPAEPAGIALSNDQLNLYVVDGADGKIRKFTRASMTEPFVDEVLFATVPIGGDGMVVDKAGMLYVVAGDKKVHVISPEGIACETALSFDVAPTSLAFGGLSMKALFITTQTELWKVSIDNLGYIPATTLPKKKKLMREESTIVYQPKPKLPSTKPEINEEPQVEMKPMPAKIMRLRNGFKKHN